MYWDAPAPGFAFLKASCCLVADGWRVVDDDDDNNQSVGESQAEGIMSTAARLFPQLETKVYRSGEEQTND
jgi:hypothetical protein